MTNEEFEHWKKCSGQDEVVCPYCYHEFCDSWEFLEGMNTEQVEVECYRCDKSFYIIPSFSTTLF